MTMQGACRKWGKVLPPGGGCARRVRMPFHHFIQDTHGWRTHADETLFANPHLEVHCPTVTSPTRAEPFTWTVTHRKGAVVVAPMTADGRLLLVRQERVPIRATDRKSVV